MRNIRRFALAIAFAAFGVLLPGTVFAAQGGIQISPLTYKFDIKPGESQIAKVTVKNLNNEAIDYTMETENFMNVSDDGAPSFQVKSAQEGVSTLADWVVFNNDEHGTIEANGKKVIEFTISVPEGAEPGGHYAALFAKQLKKSEEGKTEIGIASRVGTLALVTVPGNVRKGAEITNFTSPSFVWRGPVKFDMKVKNTGSIHFDSTSAVDLKPLIGKTSTADLGTHTIIPNNTRNFTGEWAKRFPIGYYKITAKATDADGKLLTTTATLWAIPLEIVIPLLVLIAAIYLLTRYIKTHFKIVAAKPEK